MSGRETGRERERERGGGGRERVRENKKCIEGSWKGGGWGRDVLSTNV